jgi:nucleoid-associated protein YejK
LSIKFLKRLSSNSLALLAIKNAVIHEVIKDENSIASISLSNKQLNSSDKNISSLMDKLDNFFQKRAPKRAKLLDDSLFKNFIDNNLIPIANLLVSKCVTSSKTK